ncbi:MAG TPA: VOC family protein [Aeromicrobium sp.]|nr:VOC family protein [Aeromicrobium sp.]
MNLNSILIGSDDPQRLVEYYTEILGAPARSDESYSTWMIGSGSMSVGPHSEVHGKNTQPGRLIWNIESADVEGDFQRMSAAGAIVVREPYGFDGIPGAENARIATLADPDDNYFQLMSPMGPA